MVRMYLQGEHKAQLVEGIGVATVTMKFASCMVGLHEPESALTFWSFNSASEVILGFVQPH